MAILPDNLFRILLGIALLLTAWPASMSVGPAWGLEEPTAPASVSVIKSAPPPPVSPDQSSPPEEIKPPVPQSQIKLPLTTGPIITDSAVIQAENTWTLQTTAALSLVDGAFNASWKRRPTGANQPTPQQQLAARGDYKSLLANELYYGLTSRTDISLYIPAGLNWASNVGPAGQAANFGSLGDSAITFRYMFTNGSPMATMITGYLSLGAPTGHASPLSPKLLGIDPSSASCRRWSFCLTNGCKWMPGCRCRFLGKTRSIVIRRRWLYLLTFSGQWSAIRREGVKLGDHQLTASAIINIAELIAATYKARYGGKEGYHG